MEMAVGDAIRSFARERWPVIVCIVEISLVLLGCIALLYNYERFGTRCAWDAARRQVVVGKGTVDFVSAADTWFACSGALRPGWLLAFRALGFLYFLPILMYDVYVHGFFSYRFYTQWTFTLTVAYFGLAMLVSVHGIHHNRKQRALLAGDLAQTVALLKTEEAGSSRVAPPLSCEDENAGCTGYLLQILFQVSAPAVLLTDAMFWLVLVPLVIPSGFRNNFLNINVHGVNAAFMLVEFMVNSMPFPWFRCCYFFLWSVAYTVFLWIMHTVGYRWWPYPFLDVTTPSAPIWYCGLIVLHVVAFGACSVLNVVKEQACKSCCYVARPAVPRTKTITRSFSLY